MSGEKFVQALTLGLDPVFRRLPDLERRSNGKAFAQAVEDSGVQTFTYSMIGLQPGSELLLWRLSDSLDALEEANAGCLRSGLGRWLSIKESLLGIVRPSQYVKKPTEQEQSLFSGERSQYLIVYPFTKSNEWYLLGRDVRQGVMNEHIRIGHAYPGVRQLLANSFGIDDMDFLVAYECDDLPDFGELVRALRGSESRRSTIRDTPILVGVRRTLPKILELLGA
ncbi:MAG TPA: chlorite dismutase family protein [Candidatus Acidoferrales bacterium]|nr:chlorite dismutase family protein [Candidatus Acidoferrales bacterium]